MMVTLDHDGLFIVWCIRCTGWRNSDKPIVGQSRLSFWNHSRSIISLAKESLGIIVSSECEQALNKVKVCLFERRSNVGNFFSYNWKCRWPDDVTSSERESYDEIIKCKMVLYMDSIDNTGTDRELWILLTGSHNEKFGGDLFSNIPILSKWMWMRQWRVTSLSI